MRSAVVIVLIALVPSGCLGGSSKTESTKSRSTTGEAVSAEPCRASDLKGHLEFQGAVGSLVGGVVLKNIGAGPCSLVGPPRVRFVGGAAGQQPVVIKKSAPFPGGLAISSALKPGRSAEVDMIWSNWCGPRSRPANGPGTPPDALVLSLPNGGGEVRLANQQSHFAPRCEVPRQPSTVRMSGFVVRPGKT